MAYSKNSKSAAVRAKLNHPVIDGDGHWLEPIPIFLDFLRDVGGPTIVDKFMKKAKDTSWYEMAPAERMERRPHRPTWWGEPGNSLDRATAMVPRLFYERLDDFGIDFALVYTSLGLFYVSNPDEDLRRAVARAISLIEDEDPASADLVREMNERKLAETGPDAALRWNRGRREGAAHG
jgi:hypothetical protein